MGWVFDIQQAFLNIVVHPKCRDLLRFLWRVGGRVDGAFLEYRSTRVMFGLGSSPFTLMAVLQYHLNSFGDRFPVAEKLLRDLYLDDAVSGSDDPEIACQEITQAKSLLSLCSMPIHKINTNSERVRQFLRETGAQAEFPDVTKVLGITWNPVSDVLYTDLTQFAEFTLPESCRKRDVLSLLGSVWDPTGKLSPFLLEIRLIFQETCKLKLGWKQVIPATLKDRLSAWLEGLKLINLSDVT